MIRGDVEETLRFLNELLEVDRDAVAALIEQRVPCNKAMCEHATVQVDEKGHVGLLGILNGLLGILNGLHGVFEAGEKRGWGPIAACYDHGKLLRFERSDVPHIYPVGPKES